MGLDRGSQNCVHSGALCYLQSLEILDGDAGVQRVYRAAAASQRV